MSRFSAVSFLAALFASPVMAGGEPTVTPCPADLEGVWSAELPIADLFSFNVLVEEDPTGTMTAHIAGAVLEESLPVWRSKDRFRFQSVETRLAFEVREEASGGLSAFMANGQQLTHLSMVPAPPQDASNIRRWFAPLNLIGVEGTANPLDLYIGTEDDQLAGWFFFRDPRFPSLFGDGLRCEGSSIELRERNLGLVFEGERDGADRLSLAVTGPGGVFPIEFRRLKSDPRESSDLGDLGHSSYLGARPVAIGDGWVTAAPVEVDVDTKRIEALVLAVRSGQLPRTHSVLVVRHGRLVVEEYFYGFDRDTWHDLRSASKTVASMLTGLAIDADLIPGPEARVLDYFPRYRQLENWDPSKAEITLEHLLTMSSGLDADDSDRNSVASENRYQWQSIQPDWMRLVLEAPMVASPGEHNRYGTANPLLLGGIFHSVLGGSVEWFAEGALFAPLGISDYRWFVDPTGVIYQGGGLYLRPRDLAKLGQLHLDGGRWQGEKILSESWVRRATAKHGKLENTPDQNGYGYLWWHDRYQIGEREVATYEARGNGGQYLVVVPSLDAVVVITSGNYRHRELLHQPEEILEDYVLPALVTRGSSVGGSGT